MGTELAASGPSPNQAKAIVGASAAVSIAMLDLADALRGYTHAATTTIPGIQDMRRDRAGG